MKKTLILWVALFAMCYCFSQDPLQIEDSVSMTRERWRDTIFRFNKSLVPTGILLEYSMFPFEAFRFDGVNGNDDTLKDDGKIFQLYSTLTHGIVNTNTSLDVPDSIYARAFYHNYNTGNNPLILIYQSYNRIRQSSLSEGLFTIASDDLGILDVPNRPASPYDSYEIFAFAPYKTEVVQFNAIPFSLPNELWLMPGITSVSIDFDDGAGYRTLAKGNVVNIYYGTEGVKYITAQITTTGGVRTAKCQLKYKRPDSFVQPDYSGRIEVDPIYTSEAQYLGEARLSSTNTTCAFENTLMGLLCNVRPGADVLVEDGCDRIFDKPIIIVQGFDPSGDLTFEELRRRFGSFDFISTMKAAGYDFVYVTFTKNGDFIENNAKVLEAVLNYVNQTKVGNFKSSIIGFSMGGLIVRWCLKDMEDRGISHQVDKYFSYDAPHQGSNVALGMQYIIREMVRDLPYLKFDPTIRKTIEGGNSPAARQELVTQALYTNPLEWTPSLRTLDRLRTAFAQRLQSKGYPGLTHNYAIAFGRGNNTASTKTAGNGTQWDNFGPGTKIYEGNVGWFLINLFSSAYAVPENNNSDYIARYRFQGLTWRKIFGVFPYPVYTIRVRNFVYRSLNPYDDAPGSYVTTQKIVMDGLNAGGGWLNGIAGPAKVYGHIGHNFVSIASSLDLQNQSYFASNNWQSNNMFINVDNQIQNPGTVAGNTLATPSLSPFEAVVTSTSDCGSISGCTARPYLDEFDNVIFPSGNNWNQFHNGRLEYQFAQFIVRKILNYLPSFNCQNDAFCSLNPTIIGTSSVCTSGNYSLQNLPGGNVIQWQSVNGLLQITGGQGTNNITVQRTGTGYDIIRANISNPCGATRQVNFSVRVGAFHYSEYPISGPSSECNNTTVNFSTNDLAHATNYQWSWPSDWTYVYGQGTRFLTLITGSPVYSQIMLRVDNACGTGDGLAAHNMDVYNCGGMFMAAPNPTSGTLNITANRSKKPSAQNKIFQIQIIDASGNMKKEFRYPSGVLQVTISVSNLPGGLYTIRVFNGSIWETQKVVKQ